MFDTVIIGGGVMGLGVAWRLAQAGQRVQLLERAEPGAEASSAAAGILGPQAECDAPSPFFELGLRSRELYPTFAAELRERTGIDVEHRVCGVLHAAFTDDEAARLADRARWQSAAGHAAEVVTGAALRDLEPALSERAIAALCCPREAQVDPGVLVRALARAAADAGVQIERAEAVRVRVERDRAAGVALADGRRVDAGAVVLAAGAWSGQLEGAGGLARSVAPVRGQMVCVRLRPGEVRHVVFTGHGYVVPRADGRVLAGSTMEQVGFDKAVTAGGLASILERAIHAVPALAGAKVGAHWSGLRPGTGDGLPLLGPGPIDRLFFATGHFRNGILLAPITAQLVAEAVLGRAPAVDLSPFRPDRAIH